MDDYLYKRFLELLKEHGDPATLLLHYGINGLLQEFEDWLQSEGLLVEYEKIDSDKPLSGGSLDRDIEEEKAAEIRIAGL